MTEKFLRSIGMKPLARRLSTASAQVRKCGGIVLRHAYGDDYYIRG